MKGAPVLEARHASRILPGEVPVTLVNDISLTIHLGEFVSIVGPSGSGKSSLMYLLGLLDVPTSGDILVDGASTKGFNHDRLAALRLSHLGFVFQFHFLLPEFTARDNVLLPMRALGTLSDAEQKDRANELLAQVGLKDHAHKRPDQLSGGQRQRVAIARALANDPQVILADEPTGNLDTASSAQVLTMLRHLVDEHGKALVIVTHDMALAAQADRRVTLIDGQIVSDEAIVQEAGVAG
ncbi:MAG: ABC transporter ATP-binding protein [Beijerinckiaceae bacterium]|nr:ABC transporter ATP-binding protein [Beijerinckiaceae bacterium]